MFPGSLSTFTPFTPPITLQAMNHTSRHLSYEAEITAIAAKLGINGSLDVNSVDYKLTAAFSTLAAYSSGATALTSPAITSFTNAQHTHQNAAGGGVLAAPGITSFANAAHDHSNAAGGSALGNNVVATVNVVDAAMTTRKLKPTHVHFEQGSAGEQTTTSTSYVDATGTTVDYTSGPTAETLLIGLPQ